MEKIVNVVVVIAALSVVLAIEVIKPVYLRDFVERDPDLSRPLIASTVSGGMLMVYSMLLPMVVLTLIQQGGLLNVSGGLSLKTLLGAFLTCFLIQMFAVEVLKNLCGRPRPNFFALCDYKGYAAVDFKNTSTEAWALYLQRTTQGQPGDFKYCESEDAGALNQAHLSFPSGHTSFSFGGLGFLGLVLRAAAKLQDLPESLQLVALLFPMLFAAWIGATRVRDYWHREDDVAVGGVIGLAAAGWVYSTMMAPLFEKGQLQTPSLVEVAP